MADVERAAKFQAAALVLADDVAEMAGKLRSLVRGRKYEPGQRLAVALQLTTRDLKWLLRHLPKEEEEEAER